MSTPPTAQADPLVALSTLPGVGAAFAASRSAVDAALSVVPRRRISTAQVTSTLIAATRSSTELEPDPEGWRAGAERLGGELMALAPRLRVTPGTVLARMHLLLARGVVPEDDLGRVATSTDTERLAGLNRLLVRPTQAPAGVLGAIAHAELAQLNPFGPGSGVVARAVEHLVLIATGSDPVGMIMVERAHAETVEDYRAGLAAYAEGTPAGVAVWLRHCAAATARGAELSPLLRPRDQHRD